MSKEEMHMALNKHLRMLCSFASNVLPKWVKCKQMYSSLSSCYRGFQYWWFHQLASASLKEARKSTVQGFIPVDALISCPLAKLSWLCPPCQLEFSSAGGKLGECSTLVAEVRTSCYFCFQSFHLHYEQRQWVRLRTSGCSSMTYVGPSYWRRPLAIGSGHLIHRATKLT